MIWLYVKLLANMARSWKGVWLHFPQQRYIYSCSESGPTCRFPTSTMWIHTALCHQESPDKQSTHLNIFHLRHSTAVIHLLLGHPLSLFFIYILFPSFLWQHLHLDSLHSTPETKFKLLSFSFLLFLFLNIFFHVFKTSLS